MTGNGKSMIFFFFIYFSCFFSFSYQSQSKVKDVGGIEIEGMLVFGSSLVDNGNNNFLENTTAKADYLPYGIDFPLGPSGRFTNGKNVIDFLGGFLNLPSFIPPFADPSTKGNRIVHGVDFASGGSGILDDTGSIAGNVVSLNQQIRNFEVVTLPELKVKLGYRNESSLSLCKYLFVVGSGGNDYTSNYFLRRSNTSLSLHAFTSNLIGSLSLQLKKLYSLGGRKFVLMSINPLGCYPVVRLSNPMQKGCIKQVNKAAHLFNSKLKSLVNSIKPQLSGSHFVVVNSYKILRDIINHPASQGFKDAANPCCEVASLSEGGTGILCRRGGRTCSNRRSNVFFDGLHPTEAVNFQIAVKAFASRSKTDVYPINVYHLSKI